MNNENMQQGVNLIIGTISKVYQTQLGILHQQNCFDTMKTIPDKSINLILSDLPYG